MYRSLFASGTSYRRRPRGPAPSPSQIRSVAQDAISTLKRAGVPHACFVGGMACKLYGTIRQPNDIDILCLTTTHTPEELKRALVSLNPLFYLVPSRDPLATYKVLWYHLVDTDSCVKVDLLFPGVLDIPDVSPTAITYPSYKPSTSTSAPVSLPCAPLLIVLFLKLQAWVHHGESPFIRFRDKQPVDAMDIQQLLKISVDGGVIERTGRRPEEVVLPREFVETARVRLRKFIKEYPNTKEDWGKLRYTRSKSPDPTPRAKPPARPAKI